MFRFFANDDVRFSFRTHRRRLAAAGVAILCRSLFALAGPFYLGRGIDYIVRAEGRDAVRDASLLLLVFAAGTAMAQFWMRWLWIGWSRLAEERMRLGLFSHLLGLSPAFFDRNRVGDLLSRLTSDVEMVRMGYGPGLMHALQPVVMTTGALTMMLFASPLLTAASFTPLILLFLVMRSLLPRIHDESVRVQERQAAVSTRAQETFSGARVIKAFARETHEEAAFAAESDRFRGESVRLATTRALFTVFMEFFSAAVIVVVLLVGGWLVLEGQITLGVYAAFNGYLQLLIWPMVAMGWTLSLFSRAEGAEQRVSTIRQQRSEIEEGTISRTTPLSGHVRMTNLTFTYPDTTHPVLRDVSFELLAGQTLGIVGPTGSGKSTITRLLLRLSDPPPHTVAIDDVDVRSMPLDTLRGAIALVPQEPFLFSDTLRANVTFGVDSASEEEIDQATARACLDEAIATFPDGLETLVGERGVTLSGGQRQRTAIARALLRASPILILDDALSAVDTDTERQILDRLESVISSRTTIIISHRVSTVRRADLILVLDEGRIVERGQHDALVRAGGLYARIQRLQDTEAELEQL